MPIGIGEDHLALHRAAEAWVGRHCTPSVPRALLDQEVGSHTLPPFWPALAEIGWLGLHLPEQHGGQGYGLSELAVVLEELGRAVAPGPFPPSVVVGGAVARWGDAGLQDALLPQMAAGDAVGAVVHRSGLALSGHLATHLLLHDGPGGEGLDRWAVVPAGQASVEPVASLDRTRRLARVEASAEARAGAPCFTAPTGAVRELEVTLLAAEGAGLAWWCVDTAAEYAKVREQLIKSHFN